MNTKNRCRMCLRHTEPVVALAATPFANAFASSPDSGALRWPLELHQCRKCGHIQIGHIVAGSKLFTQYAYRTPEAAYPALLRAAHALKDRYGLGRVLEIGCNNGLYLRALREVGFSAIGIDPAAGCEGVTQFFTHKLAQSIGQSNKFDLVVSNNTFAHVDDLRDLFRGINEVLAPGGAVVFEVQYARRMIERGMFDMIYHEHKDYHTVAPWARFLPRFAGLNLMEVEFIPQHGGSIRVHAGRNGARLGWTMPDDERVDWSEFVTRINTEKQRLIMALKSVRHQIIMVGATAKACTLLHQLGAAGYIAYAVDSTPEKIGKYVPGTDIKILHPDVLHESKSARTLLLTAWNYEDEFRRQFPNDEFIVPFSQQPVQQQQQRAA